MKKNKAYRILNQLMKGTLSSDIRIDIYRWILSDKSSSEKEDAFWQIWEETPSTADSSLDNSLLETKKKIEATKETLPQVNFFKKIARYAAILILPLISGLSVWYLMQQNKIEPTIIECYTPFRETQMIELTDGSKVQVNAGSLLVYPDVFTGDTRTVYLSGEAFFDIAPMKDKPFIVKVNGQEVKVLGTKFNVLAYPNDSLIVTTLIQGSVELATAKSNGIVLDINQQYVYNKRTESGEINNSTTFENHRWTSGYYSFTEESLNSVFSRLSQIYGYTFTITTRDLNNKKITATFYKEQPIDDILEIIRLSIPMKYSIEGQNIFISNNSE